MIDISRRRRIAAGSGVDPADVSGLVKQFDAMAAVVKQMAQMSMIDKIRTLTGLGRAAALQPGRSHPAHQGRDRQAALAQGTRKAEKTARKRRTPPPARTTKWIRLTTGLVPERLVALAGRLVGRLAAYLPL